MVSRKNIFLMRMCILCRGDLITVTFQRVEIISRENSYIFHTQIILSRAHIFIEKEEGRRNISSYSPHTRRQKKNTRKLSVQSLLTLWEKERKKERKNERKKERMKARPTPVEKVSFWDIRLIRASSKAKSPKMEKLENSINKYNAIPQFLTCYGSYVVILEKRPTLGANIQHTDPGGKYWDASAANTFLQDGHKAMLWSHQVLQVCG